MPRARHSLVVTELTSAKVCQMRLDSLMCDVTRLQEDKAGRIKVQCPLASEDGCEVRRYAAATPGHNA